MRRNRGFTLIEMLVVLGIMSVFAHYLFGILAASNATYAVVDQVTESQQGMRAVAHLMERDIRHLGKMVPLAAGLCADDNQAAPDVLYVSDADAIDPDDDFATYAGAQVQGLILNVANTGNTINLPVDSLTLEPSPPARPRYDTDGDGTNDSDFQVGGGAIIIDLNNTGRGAACGTVTAVDLGTPSVTVRIVSDVLGNTGAAVQLAVVPAHEYRIANGDQLLRNGDMLAEGIEDLQLAYILDANDNNVIDPGEVHGSGSGVNANFDAKDTEMSDLRQVRLNLVSRTRNEDVDFRGQLDAVENRAAGAPDGFRRRVYTSIVRPRNMARDA